MRRATMDAWTGSDVGDLKERDIDDVPEKGLSVRVRALPAAYSNLAMSEATVFKTVGREQIATIDQAKLQVLQFAYGMVDPKPSLEQAQLAAEKWGPAFEKVVEAIADLSNIDEEAMRKAQATFPHSPGGEEGRPGVGVANGSGDAGPVEPVRAGAGVEDDG